MLAAVDPAQPYGAALAWPASERRPQRVAGAYVVLIGGEPIVYLEMLNSTPEPDGTYKRYLERIDPNAYGGMAGRSCHAAMASRWRPVCRYRDAVIYPPVSFGFHSLNLRASNSASSY